MGRDAVVSLGYPTIECEVLILTERHTQSTDLRGLPLKLCILNSRIKTSQWVVPYPGVYGQHKQELWLLSIKKLECSWRSGDECDQNTLY